MSPEEFYRKPRGCRKNILIIKTYLNKYKIIKKNFARGGNSVLHKIKDKNLNEFILKELSCDTKEEKIKAERFKREIEVVKKYQNVVKGILPILDDSFNEYTSQSNSLWYVMEEAIPIHEYLVNRGLYPIISCIISVTETIVELHKCRVVHRDIKPSNIFYYKNGFVLGDFGLVSYPDASTITKTGSRIGNYATIAPEMRFLRERADARPADVWSIGKTFWMLLFEKYNSCFEGSYDEQQNLFPKYYPDVPYVHFNEILKLTTQYDPTKRITAPELLNKMEQLLEHLGQGKKIINYNEWSSIENNEDRFHLTTNRKYDTSTLIRKIALLDSHDYVFRETFPIVVQCFKELSYRLKNIDGIDFIVTPIIPHEPNANLPKIDIYVKYTSIDSKFITSLVGGVDADSQYYIYDFHYSDVYPVTRNDEIENTDAIVDAIYKRINERAFSART